MYFEKIINSMFFNFSDVVTIGEHIENGLKTGKIYGAANQKAVAKKP